MSSASAWRPRVLTQGCFMVAADGTAHSVMTEMPDSPRALLYLNPWEISPEGLQAASDYALRHLDDYAAWTEKSIRRDLMCCFVEQVAEEKQRAGELKQVGNLSHLRERKGLEAAAQKVFSAIPELAEHVFEGKPADQCKDAARELIEEAQRRLSAASIATLPQEFRREAGIEAQAFNALSGPAGEAFYAASLTDDDRRKVIRGVAEKTIEQWKVNPSRFVDTVETSKRHFLPQTAAHMAASIGDHLYAAGMYSFVSKPYFWGAATLLGSVVPVMGGLLASAVAGYDLPLVAQAADITYKAGFSALTGIPFASLLGGQLSRLVSHPPEWGRKKGERVIRRVKNEVERYDADTLSLLQQSDPLIFAVGKCAYALGNAKLGRQFTVDAKLGEPDQATGHLSVCAFALLPLSLARYSLLEELRHTINERALEKASAKDLLPAFADAFFKDKKLSSARALYDRYANKKFMMYPFLGSGSYPHKPTMGAEALVELDFIRIRMMEKEKIPETEALRRMNEAFPNMGPLYAQYMSHEQALRAPVAANDNLLPCETQEPVQETRQEHAQKLEERREKGREAGPSL